MGDLRRPGGPRRQGIGAEPAGQAAFQRARRAGGGRGGPRVPRDALAARRRAVSGRHARRQRLEDGHREARARPGDVARRVLQHVLHRAEGAGGDVRLEAGGPAQVPGARPRLRAPGARPGARARAPQRARRRAPGAGGGVARPCGARGPSRGGPATAGGGAQGLARGGGGPQNRAGRARQGDAPLGGVGGAARSHAVARRPAPHRRACGDGSTAGIPAARQGVGRGVKGARGTEAVGARAPTDPGAAGGTGRVGGLAARRGGAARGVCEARGAAPGDRGPGAAAG